MRSRSPRARFAKRTQTDRRRRVFAKRTQRDRRRGVFAKRTQRDRRRGVFAKRTQTRPPEEAFLRNEPSATGEEVFLAKRTQRAAGEEAFLRNEPSATNEIPFMSLAASTIPGHPTQPIENLTATRDRENRYRKWQESKRDRRRRNKIAAGEARRWGSASGAREPDQDLRSHRRGLVRSAPGC